VHQRLHSALLTLQDKWLGHFSDREELDIGLDMLLFWYRDLLSITYGSDDITYFDQKATLERVALRFSEMEVVARLQAILEAKRRLRANANAQLLMEQLLIQLQEGS
jgi:DNA polymerase-3 subunit delta'